MREILIALWRLQLEDYSPIALLLQEMLSYCGHNPIAIYSFEVVQFIGMSKVFLVGPFFVLIFRKTTMYAEVVSSVWVSFDVFVKRKYVFRDRKLPLWIFFATLKVMKLS